MPYFRHSSWQHYVPTAAALPAAASSSDGDVRITLDTDEVWCFDGSTATWVKIGGPGSAGLTYKGTWNAATNVPALPLGTEVAGEYYVVSVAGTTSLSGITDWAPFDWAIYNGTVWQKIDNSDLVPIVMEFSAIVGVPGAGTRYLSREAIATTAAPVLLPAAAVLRGITVVVDSADAVRNYIVEVVSDPAGVPIVIGSGLVLPLGSTSATVRTLSASIGVGVLWGVRIRRTSGAGASTFANVRVEVEVQMP